MSKFNLLFFIIQVLSFVYSSSIYYTPYIISDDELNKLDNTDDSIIRYKDKYQMVNSVYGTGDKLKDLVYKAQCSFICELERDDDDKRNDEGDNTITDGSDKKGKKRNRNRSCCVGEINSLTCMNRDFCQVLKSFLQHYLVGLIISIYIATIIITMIIIFCIFYLLSLRQIKINEAKKDNISHFSDIEDQNESTQISLTKKQALINGIVAAIIVLLSSFIIPIIIVKIIAMIKKVSITKLLGGDFKMISSTSLASSIRVKNERKKKYIILENQNNTNNGNNGNNANNMNIHMPMYNSDSLGKKLYEREDNIIHNNQSDGINSADSNRDIEITTSKKLKLQDDDNSLANNKENFGRL